MHSKPVCSAATADACADLEAMLAPLRSLAEVTGLRRAVENFAEDIARPLPVAVSLELDPRAPHLSFVEQLIELTAQVATTRGVAFTPLLCCEIDRLAAHARCVAEAWAGVRGARMKPTFPGVAP